MEETPDKLAAKFQVIFPHLDERQRRLLMGAEARVLGHGGIRGWRGLPESGRPPCRWESTNWTPAPNPWTHCP
jgi:hypothetical protein